MLICHFVTHEGTFQKENAEAFYGGYFANYDLPSEERGLIFNAGIFFSLMYIPFDDPAKDWERIQFTRGNEGLLRSVIEVERPMA